ncbi:MAG: demethoxyubiquinone hydroxylase family protein [Alphaproteobacteria bacterium]|nr:demethoxyubiquinone hydroxylase family protein [Alphaproteobacteria bacterium]
MTEEANKTTQATPLPGDPSREEVVRRMIRVDHAGEYGAVQIYKGQMAVLGRSGQRDVLQRMLDQEQAHLDTFEEWIANRRVRPTLLTPCWHFAGYALGVATALMGERAAMACTVAVEEVIDEHYEGQLRQLGEEESELKDTIAAFRADELAHKDLAIEHGAEEAPGYTLLSGAVKAASRLAIWLSTRM